MSCLTKYVNIDHDSDMDPKQNSNQPLDPKLQEVYDRVMGTNPSAGAPTPPSATDTTAVPPTMPTQPPMPATPAEPAMPTTPMAEPPMPAMPTQTGDESSSLPPVPPIPSVPPVPAEPPMNTPAQQPLPPMPDVTVPPTPPVSPTPSTDDTSTTPATPLPSENTDSSNTPADTMRATMPNVIQHAETIKIGMGGSPVSSGTTAKKKGISPFVLIFGAFAFLLVYAVFWVKFFGYSLPFLTK